MYIIEGVIEAILCLFVMFLTKSIYYYVLKFEEEETSKYNPQQFNDLSNYWLSSTKIFFYTPYLSLAWYLQYYFYDCPHPSNIRCNTWLVLRDLSPIKRFMRLIFGWRYIFMFVLWKKRLLAVLIYCTKLTLPVRAFFHTKTMKSFADYNANSKKTLTNSNSKSMLRS